MKRLMCFLLACAAIIGFWAVVYVQGLETKTQKPCTLEDLGISTITQEKIVSASFDSQNPILSYDIQNLSQVEELLRTLQGAVFYKVYASPQEPYYTSVIIRTVEKTYGIGIVNSLFCISVNGEVAYYHSSAAVDFQEELDEIHVRNLDDGE